MSRIQKRTFFRWLALWSGLALGVVGANSWLKAQSTESAADATETAAAAPAETEPAAAEPKAFAEMTMEEKVDTLAASSLVISDDGKVTSNIYSDANALWTCLAAFLVFFMQAGFAMVEAGLTRAKNTVNILINNVMDFVLGSIVFWIFGFGLMFGATAATNGWVGTGPFFFDATTAKPDDVAFGWAFLIFQTVFCATAATIVSGAMAERTKFSSYLIYTVAITALIYPIFGSWVWGSLWEGSAWLGSRGFLDFAGSTVVHSVGGWAALAGAIFVGPRIGKFMGNKAMAIPGHSMPLLCVGVFVLWLGWFGFNPGSTTAVGGGNFAYIAVTTNMAACGGGLTAMLTAWALFKKPDMSFTLNGILAGLVGITAGCDVIPVPYALVTGMIAGVVVVFSCVMFDKIKVDDPVGAISVHGVCGVVGTLAVGLFHRDLGLFTGGGPGQLMIQALGAAVAFVWSFGMSSLVFMAIRATIGLRVSEQEELDGLDLHEHGMAAYPVGWVAVSDGVGGHPVSAGGPPVSGVPQPAGVTQAAM